MQVVFFQILKAFIRFIYFFIKPFAKRKDRIVYLSRQSNEKSIDMILLEQEIAKLSPNTEQVFRLKMIDDGLLSKIQYCFHLVGDMKYIASSKVAILDTYSIPISVLKKDENLKVVQIWHALAAIKKFGLQSLGTKEGRSEKLSQVMRMHKNYDYVIAPSKATAEFYCEAFGCESNNIKICPLPRVDYITDSNSRSSEFFSLNPGMANKKIVLYLPTFRDREAYITHKLIVEFQESEDIQLLVCNHPLSEIDIDNKYKYRGDFSTFDLMKIADVIITDYSACSVEASLLMKPIYFYVPDYEEYSKERGLNVDLKNEMPSACFEDADQLFESIIKDDYDLNCLFEFRRKFVGSTDSSCSELLAKFITMLN